MLHLARWTSSAAVLLVLLPASGGARATQEVVERHPSLSHEEEPGGHIEEPEALGPTRCQGGSAGPFPCSNVDLLSFMPLSSIGGDGTTHGNDLWGWTDPLNGREYALMGLTTGTAFVDITNPKDPLYVGLLPAQTLPSTWLDLKVYKNYAFIVSEAPGQGMQVFDLKQLRKVGAPPVVFSGRKALRRQWPQYLSQHRHQREERIRIRCGDQHVCWRATHDRHPETAQAEVCWLFRR